MYGSIFSSCLNNTSFSSRFVSNPARSPGLSSTGPDEILIEEILPRIETAATKESHKAAWAQMCKAIDQIKDRYFEVASAMVVLKISI